jgi:hypothetical protein
VGASPLHQTSRCRGWASAFLGGLRVKIDTCSGKHLRIKFQAWSIWTREKTVESTLSTIGSNLVREAPEYGQHRFSNDLAVSKRAYSKSVKPFSSKPKRLMLPLSRLANTVKPILL